MNATSEANETESESVQFTEKWDMFTSLTQQLSDVRELRKQYDEVNALNNYVPKWKRTGADMFISGPPHSVLPHVRNAPELTLSEAESLYVTIPPARALSYCTLARIWNCSVKETRRRCYWLSRRHFIKYDANTARITRREGDDKGRTRISSSFGRKEDFCKL